MSEIDTSKEAVERLAQLLACIPFDMTVDDFDQAAATLRALAGEMDAGNAARASEREALNRAIDLRDARIVEINTDRDRLAAEVARLREALKEAAQFLKHTPDGTLRELYAAGEKARAALGDKP